VNKISVLDSTDRWVHEKAPQASNDETVIEVETRLIPSDEAVEEIRRTRALLERLIKRSTSRDGLDREALLDLNEAWGETTD
jgi:hypothetical protein